MRRRDWNRLRWQLADVGVTVVVGGVVLGLLAGFGWVIWQNVEIQRAAERSRHEASRERAAALLTAFSEVPPRTAERDYREAIERAEDPMRAERARLVRYAKRVSRVEMTVKVEEQFVPPDSAYTAWSAYCYAYHLPLDGTGAPGYREVECPVEKPLICEALGEDCEIFGLRGRVA